MIREGMSAMLPDYLLRGDEPLPPAVTEQLEKIRKDADAHKKDEEKKELDASHLTTKYTPKKPPELKSKYVQFLQKLKQDSLAGKNTMASVGMFNKDYGNTGCEI